MRLARLGMVAKWALIAAGYELTPLKRMCLGRCRSEVKRRPANPAGAGLRYGIDCVGCSAGLMAVLFALGAMNVLWMTVVAALVLAEKVWQRGPSLPVPIALFLIGLGTWAAFDPSSVPGLTTPM